MPPSSHPSGVLARHEQGLLEENRTILMRTNGHRSEEFNRLILPKCESIVRAIGHRMAYDAAVDSGLSEEITNLYLAAAVKQDSAWYVENLGFSRDAQSEAMDQAINGALGCLDEWLSRTEAEEYAKNVPILSQESWDRFVDGLEGFNSPLSAKL